MQEDIHYLYLLREREFIIGGKNIYKIGRTVQKQHQRPFQRFEGYSKDTEIQVMRSVPDCIIAERQLLQLFKNKFTHRVDIGREYFEGDPNLMSQVFFDFVQDIKNANSDQPVAHSNMHFCLPPNLAASPAYQNDLWSWHLWLQYVLYMSILLIMSICVLLLIIFVLYVLFFSY